MKPIRRWNSDNHPLQQFKNELDGVFQRFFDDPFFSRDSFFNQEHSFTPACNIEEKSDRYMIEAELPGVEPEEVEIELDGNVMTIKGERTLEEETKDEDKQMHIVEHSYGSFHRSFALPDNIDPDNITAENKNG